MALQDISPVNNLIDPTTGQPYPYGSPGYMAAITPFLESELGAQANEAANARGGFYSGPAAANAQQAEEQLLGNIAQQGAAQSVQQQELQQQEQFASQQQREQNQANADAQKAMASAQAKAGALSAGIGGLSNIGGNLGTLAIANKMGWLNPKGVGVANPAATNPASTSIGNSAPGGYTSSTGEGSGLGGSSSVGGAPSGLSAAEELNAESALPPAEATPSSGLGGLGTGLMDLGAGAIGSYGGNMAENAMLGANENNQWGGPTANRIESGIGGAIGGTLGSALGPGGAMAGSFIGSAGLPMYATGVQNEVTNPLKGGIADLALGPLGPLAMGIPGFSQGMSDAGNWIGARLGL